MGWEGYDAYMEGIRQAALLTEMRNRVCFCDPCCTFWYEWETQGGRLRALHLEGARTLAEKCLTRAIGLEDD